MNHDPSGEEWAKLKAELLDEITSDIRREAKVARRPWRSCRLLRVAWRNGSRRFDSSLFMRWGLRCLGFVVFWLPFLVSVFEEVHCASHRLSLDNIGVVLCKRHG